MQQLAEFAGNHILLVSALLVSFFLIVFSELQRKARGLTNLPSADAIRFINQGAAIIDLRSPELFAQGHIAEARNIPLDQFEADNKKISGMQEHALLLVCENGTNCSSTVEKLRKRGFEKAFGLHGGVNAWRQENLPLVAGKKRKKKS